MTAARGLGSGRAAAALWIAGSALLPSSLALAPVALAAQTADREVVSLRFEGNRAFSDARLAAAIATDETACRSFLFVVPFPFCPLTNWGFAHERAFLDERELPADLLRLRVFYRQRGYRSVRVDTAVSRLDGRARVVFRIEEGEPVRIDSLAIAGIEGVLEPERVRRDFPLREGDPFDRVRLDAGKELVRDRLLNLGHVDAVVLEDTYIPPGEGARVRLEVAPGRRTRVGEVRIEGTESLSPGLLRRFLAFESGQYYDQRKLFESQRNLYSLDAIRFANVAREAEPAPGDTTVDVRVEVTEATPRTIRAGVGLSTTECALTETRFIHRNFLGRARRLELSGRLSNILADQRDGAFPCTDVGGAEVFQQLDFRLRAELRQPYFLAARTSLRGALFLERESFPDIFVRRSSGAELALTRRVRPRLPLTVSYRLEFTGFVEESADIFFCVNFAFCQPEDIDLLIERRLLSPITLTARYDRTDVPFSPTRGYYVNAEVERADRLTASAYQYLRFALEVADFESVGPGTVVAARLRGGFVEPTGGLAFDPDPRRAGRIVHPRKRFFAGGPQSVRGFGQNLLGPRVLAVDSVRHCPEAPLPACASDLAATNPGAFDERPVGGNAALEASLELRQDLGGPWGLAAFVDLGQVWRELDDPEAPVLTPGAGVRYRSPVGPLRLDVGYNPSSAERLSVIAQLPDGELRELPEPVLFDPFTHDDPGRLREFVRRLQLHISIGEAF